MTDTSHRLYAVVDRAGRVLRRRGPRSPRVRGRPRSPTRVSPRSRTGATSCAPTRSSSQQVVAARMAAYRTALQARRAQIAAAAQSRARRHGSPAAAAVRVVNLPPLTITRTLVMLRRRFSAMGTDIELLLDAPAGDRSRRGARAGRRPSSSGSRQVLSRFRRDSELSAPQPRRHDRRRAPICFGRRARAAVHASGPEASSTRPSTTRSWPRATTARSTSWPPRPRHRARTGVSCGGARRISTDGDSSSSPGPASTSADRQGLRRRSRRRAARS